MWRKFDGRRSGSPALVLYNGYAPPMRSAYKGAAHWRTMLPDGGGCLNHLSVGGDALPYRITKQA
jgi:hypothetical protein